MEHQNRLGRRLQIRKIKDSLRFPSLFSRLVCIYIMILAFMLAVLFVTFTHSFQSYFVKYTEEIMINQAKTIASQYHRIGEYSDSCEEAFEEITESIQMMNAYLGAITWVVDRQGIGIKITEYETSILEQEVGLEDCLEEVFKGNVVGFEDGFSDSFSTPVVTIGYPIVLEGGTRYALFIHTSMPYILQTIDEVRNMILKVVGFVGSIAFIWIYMISKQMTKPLKEMNQVAKNIASGEFNERIEVKGNDEIAQLGLSLNHMAEALDKIEEDRKGLIANISHDLRSPLTSIQGFVTAILDGTIDTAYQDKYLKIVLSESQRLISMTNAILELNHRQEGIRKAEKVQLNICHMIEIIALSLENRRKEKNVHIHLQLDNEHVWTWGERDGISRVLQNLLDNAIKFVEPKGHILIRTKAIRDKLWVSIYNDGPYIPEDQQKMIWERFYKGDRSRGQDRRGVGLGLVIVKEILKQHDEVIFVRSEKGEMVEFRFSLELVVPVERKLL